MPQLYLPVPYLLLDVYSGMFGYTEQEITQLAKDGIILGIIVTFYGFVAALKQVVMICLRGSVGLEKTTIVLKK